MYIWIVIFSFILIFIILLNYSFFIVQTKITLLFVRHIHLYIVGPKIASNTFAHDLAQLGKSLDYYDLYMLGGRLSPWQGAVSILRENRLPAGLNQCRS